MSFHLLKVRIQTQKQYTGVWQCIVTTFSKEGVGALSMNRKCGSWNRIVLHVVPASRRIPNGNIWRRLVPL